MPQWTSDDDAPLAEFSTKRALEQVKNISQKPHFVGSENHEVVANYLVKELQNMGLQTSLQEGYCLFGLGNFDQMQKHNGSNKRYQQRQSLAPSFAL